MNPSESLRVAFRALVANKLRSALTMLGIVIGVAAVVALMSIGRGAQASITSQISSMGTNLIYISPGGTTQSGVSGGAGTAASLTWEDADALTLLVPSANLVAPATQTSAQVWASGVNWRTRVLGVTPEAQQVNNYQVADGEFITKASIDGSSRVAVVGSTIVEKLFADGRDPIGQSVRINEQQFRVIGVLASKGGTGFMSQDDVVLVPLSTAMNRLMAQRTARGGRSVSTIYVQVAGERLIDQAVQEIKDVLRERHRLTTGDDDFRITTQKDMLAALDQVMGVLTLFLGAIASISLLVGGIGIMNIMLVSVTERTREIGIRKAVGAKRRDILAQFLIESVVLSGVGGVLGIGLGWGLSLLVARIPMGTTSIQGVVTPDIPILAFCVSAAIGLFFGLYPANRAARLNPIDALRYE